MPFFEESGTVIVGASLAGLTCAQSLRAEGYTKKITLIGAEKHLPYNRPPLSKQVLSGKWQATQTKIDSDEKFIELQLDFLIDEEAIELNVGLQEITTKKHTLKYEELIIATGASVRRLPGTEGMSRVHVLRTIDDALGLRDALVGIKSAVVVGAGVLGSEVISALSEHGIHATNPWIVQRPRRPARVHRAIAPPACRVRRRRPCRRCRAGRPNPGSAPGPARPRPGSRRAP